MKVQYLIMKIKSGHFDNAKALDNLRSIGSGSSVERSEDMIIVSDAGVQTVEQENGGNFKINFKKLEFTVNELIFQLMETIHRPLARPVGGPTRVRIRR